MMKITRLFFLLSILLLCQISSADDLQYKNEAEVQGAAFASLITKGQLVNKILMSCTKNSTDFEPIATKVLSSWTERNEKYFVLIAGLRESLQKSAKNEGRPELAEELEHVYLPKILEYSVSTILKQIETSSKEQTNENCLKFADRIFSGRGDIAADLPVKAFLDQRLATNVAENLVVQFEEDKVNSDKEDKSIFLTPKLLGELSAIAPFSISTIVIEKDGKLIKQNQLKFAKHFEPKEGSGLVDKIHGLFASELLTTVRFKITLTNIDSVTVTIWAQGKN